MVKKIGENLNKELCELSKMQQGFDDVVMGRFPELKTNTSIVWKINALVVEMGECLQEWKGFKMWKEDQTSNHKEMKEEYVDWFHFVLSIGLEFGYQFEDTHLRPEHYYDFYRDRVENEKELDVINEAILEWNILLFQNIYKDENENYQMEDLKYEEVLELFIAIGVLIGLTWDGIHEGYLEKNKENHNRQENGY